MNQNTNMMADSKAIENGILTVELINNLKFSVLQNIVELCSIFSNCPKIKISYVKGTPERFTANQTY